MKIKIFYAFIAINIITCLWGCQPLENANIYNGDIKYVESFPQSIPLKGEIINIDNLGAETIDCIDSLLIFARRKMDTFYSVYSTQGLKHLGDYISEGTGPNEMISICYPIFLRKEQNNNLLYICDNHEYKIKALNLSKSVLENQTVMEEKIELDKTILHKFSYPINDSTYFLHGFNIDKKNDYYAIYHGNNNQLSISDFIYNTPLQNIGDMFLYNSYGCFNEKTQNYATAMQFFNQINIFPCNGHGSPFSIILGDKPLNIKDIEKIQMPEKIEYYQDMTCTDEYLFALYAGCNRKDWAFENNVEVKIHMFDWNGNPICQFIPDKKIAKIAVDEKHQLLYGMTLEEEVYKYKLSF